MAIQTTTTGAAALLAASEIKGSTVRNRQRKGIGEIDEVLIDPDSGRVRFAILSVGGFLGLGSTRVAVPWSALEISRQGGRASYTLDATKERLEKAPRVEGKNYEHLYAQEAAAPVFVYWDEVWIA